MAGQKLEIHDWGQTLQKTWPSKSCKYNQRQDIESPAAALCGEATRECVSAYISRFCLAMCSQLFAQTMYFSFCTAIHSNSSVSERKELIKMTTDSPMIIHTMRMQSSATAGIHSHVLWCRGHVYIIHVSEQMIQAEYLKHDGNNWRSIIVFVVNGFYGFPVSYRAFHLLAIVVNQMLRYCGLMPSTDILA